MDTGQSAKSRPKGDARRAAPGGCARYMDDRIIQRCLVYAVGISEDVCTEQVLRSPEMFGKYGSIKKLSINFGQAASLRRPQAGAAYVVFYKPDDARACIEGINDRVVAGKTIKACYGTTKYCHAFLKGMACNNQDCQYLHELAAAEDTVKKGCMSQLSLRSTVRTISTGGGNGTARSVSPHRSSVGGASSSCADVPSRTASPFPSPCQMQAGMLAAGGVSHTLPASDSWPSLCDAPAAKAGAGAVRSSQANGYRRTAKDIVLGHDPAAQHSSDISTDVPVQHAHGEVAALKRDSASSEQAGCLGVSGLESEAPDQDTGTQDGNEADGESTDGNNGCNSNDAVVKPSLWAPGQAMRDKVQAPFSDAPDLNDTNEQYSVALPYGLLDDSDAGELSPSHDDHMVGWTDTLSAPSPTIGEAKSTADTAPLPVQQGSGSAQAMHAVGNSAPLTAADLAMQALSVNVPGQQTSASSMQSAGSGSQSGSPMYGINSLLQAAESYVGAASDGSLPATPDENLLRTINAQLRAMQRSASMQQSTQPSAPDSATSGEGSNAATAHSIPANDLLVRKVALLQQVCSQMQQQQQQQQQQVQYQPQHHQQAYSAYAQQPSQPLHNFQQHQYGQASAAQQYAPVQAQAHQQTRAQMRTHDMPPQRDLQLLQQMLLQQVAQQQVSQPRQHAQPQQQRYGHRASYHSGHSHHGTGMYQHSAQRAHAPSAMTAALQYGTGGQRGGGRRSYASHNHHSTMPLHTAAHRLARPAQHDGYAGHTAQYGQGASRYGEQSYSSIRHALNGAALSQPYRQDAGIAMHQAEHDAAARAAMQAKMQTMGFTRSSNESGYDVHGQPQQHQQWGAQQSMYQSMSRY